MPFLNLTSALGTSNSLYYNTSYIIANQPPQMTTPAVWYICMFLGIGLLLFSRYTTEPTCKDLSGIIAAPFLLISAIQAFAVDVITGTTFTSGTTAPYLGVIIETHTVYHYDVIGVILGIIFVISLANLYLLWLDYKRITEQEKIQMNQRARVSRGGEPEREDAREKDERDK